MKKIMTILFLVISLACSSCNGDWLEYGSGDIQICVERGENWFHDFPLFLGINKKNAPQMAIWIEDMNGKYISTVYVTHKIATQSWQAAGSNRRKEALPHWAYSRGVRYEDGLYLPTKKHPLTDAASGATPKRDFNVKVVPAGKMERFVVKIEVNHSTDFNDAYPKSAELGEKNYSGGKMGSGQPALIYAADVNLLSDKKEVEAVLIGHSSPDGSDGEVYTDMSRLTTALNIVKRITVKIWK